MSITRTTRSLSTEAARAARRWYVADAEGKVLGRLASRVALVLRGKTNPGFSPHLDAGDFVVVVNAAKIRLTGEKLEKKEYIRHTTYPGRVRRAAAARAPARRVLRARDLAHDRAPAVRGHLDRGPVPHRSERAGGRRVGAGGGDPPRHHTRAAPSRPRAPLAAQEGGLHHPRSARGRAQEVRAPQGAQAAAVLEALSRRPSGRFVAPGTLVAYCARPWRRAGRWRRACRWPCWARPATRAWSSCGSSRGIRPSSSPSSPRSSTATGARPTSTPSSPGSWRRRCGRRSLRRSPRRPGSCSRRCRTGRPRRSWRSSSGAGAG